MSYAFPKLPRGYEWTVEALESDHVRVAIRVAGVMGYVLDLFTDSTMYAIPSFASEKDVTDTAKHLYGLFMSQHDTADVEKFAANMQAELNGGV